MDKAIVRFALALVGVGVHGQRPDEAWEFRATFPLQDHEGKVLQPSLLEGLDILTRDIAEHVKSAAVTDAEQWNEEAFFKRNGVSNSSAFCFTVPQDNGSVQQDGEEQLMQWTLASFANNQSAGVSTNTNGSAVGHFCCAGHAPNESQLASTSCYRTLTPEALFQVLGGEGLIQSTVGADGSITMGSVKKHVHSGLMRSEGEMEAEGGDEADDPEGGDEADDPRIFPTEIFMASLRDGVDSESLELAVEQVAHLARATNGLFVVDKRLFGKLTKALGRHPARFRVIQKFFIASFFIAFAMAKMLGGVAVSAWYNTRGGRGRRRR